MATFNLVLQNNSSRTRNYALLVGPPLVGGNPFDSRVLVCVLSSQLVQEGGSWEFTVLNDYYGWTGSAPTHPAPGVRLESLGFLPVSLGTPSQPGTTFDLKIEQGSNPSLVPNSTPIAHPGGFIIQTGPDVPSPSPILIGVAQTDSETGLVLPTSVMVAQPESTTEFLPIPKFYIASIDDPKGQIVDFASIMWNSGVVDFTRQPLTTATVVHNQDGRFSVNMAGNINARLSDVVVPNLSSPTAPPLSTVEGNPNEGDECGPGPKEVGDALTESAPLNLNSTAVSEATAVIKWKPYTPLPMAEAAILQLRIRLTGENYGINQGPVVQLPDGSLTMDIEVKLLAAQSWGRFQSEWVAAAAPILAPENAQWSLSPRRVLDG